MKLSALIITCITFILFYIEAIIHYNIGKNGKNKIFHLDIPDKKELLNIALIILFFSIINGLISGFILKHIHKTIIL
jgi:hypothetical protein